MPETTFEKIQRKTGRKQVECKCNICKSQCTICPCLGTPEDILNLIKAGYLDRLSPTEWRSGIYMGLTDKPVNIIAPTYDERKGACTFFTNGLCELHDRGLKPTEGKLSSHLLAADNFDKKKSVTWAVVKEWLTISDDEQDRMLES
jgi:hypothetical protein